MKRIIKSIKKIHRKLKYLDRTKKRYFTTMIFISSFSLFIGVTYSYFYITEHLSVATIAIAKLNYTLSSTSDRFNAENKTVSLNAGETLSLTLTLKSLNAQETKYALSYNANAPVKVYYSEEFKNNMTGVIGITNSEIVLHIILVNSGTTDETVNLITKGGYLQNILTSNITEGFFPQDADVIVRTTLLDENLENSYTTTEFPTKESDYAYFKTDCSSSTATPIWDNEAWNLKVNDVTERTNCDVYFKKVTNDIETYYLVIESDGSKKYLTTAPDTTYAFKSASCNQGTATWNNDTQQLELTDIGEKNVCIAEFTKN